MIEQRIMPAFVFARRRDIELDADFILAGMLIVNLPREVKKLDQQQMVAAIIRQLMDAAQSGRMAADALVCGWHGGRRPPNAVDISNDEVMAAWARDCLTIGVRVDPRNDGRPYIDSDIMRQVNPSDTPSGKAKR
jgi:hypothetical protein